MADKDPKNFEFTLPDLKSVEIPDRPLRIVFMGTPEFAVPTLQALIDGPHDVVAVYTQPDRPQGRGRKMMPPAIKKLAVEAGLPVFQPEKMACKESYERFQQDKPDLAVVIAYGKILRKRMLSVPALGCVNCHASLLPYYRGAAPIFWALAAGEKESGITTMQMDPGMDTGPMLLRRSLEIGENENVSSLHDRLANLSADLLTETLEAIIKRTLSPTEQEHDKATYASMLKAHHRWIDFSKSAKDVHNWIRAMDPFPGARTNLNGKMVKLFDSHGVVEYNGKPGELVAMAEDACVIACGKKSIMIKGIQLPGKKRTTVKQYLAGNSFADGTIFETPEEKLSDPKAKK